MSFGISLEEKQKDDILKGAFIFKAVYFIARNKDYFLAAGGENTKDFSPMLFDILKPKPFKHILNFEWINF